MRKITTEILRRLRALMKDPLHTGGEVLSAYIVPSCDAHNSEYLCERVRIYYLTSTDWMNILLMFSYIMQKLITRI